MSSNPNPVLGAVAVTWAIVGWAGALAFAIARLSMIAIEGLSDGLTPLQFAVLVVNTAALGWAEGYRGFQQKFSPRAVARVLYLRSNATLTRAALAPLFCVGFLGATPRLLRVTWIGTALIVLAVLLVQRLPQPWRGIVDAGVVLGLSWGLVSFLVMTRAALAAGHWNVAPEVREEAGRAA
jgi:hypothetical protein